MKHVVYKRHNLLMPTALDPNKEPDETAAKGGGVQNKHEYDYDTYLATLTALPPRRRCLNVENFVQDTNSRQGLYRVRCHAG